VHVPRTPNLCGRKSKITTPAPRRRPKQDADPVQIFFNTAPKREGAAAFHEAMRTRVPQNRLQELPEVRGVPSKKAFSAYLDLYECNQMYYRQEAERGNVDLEGILRLEAWFMGIVSPDGQAKGAGNPLCDAMLADIIYQ